MRRVVLVLSLVVLGAGIALLVWANLRPYADNQRNGAFLFGAFCSCAGVSGAVLSIIGPRPPRTRPPVGHEDGRRWRSGSP